ncbi:unnamed protein product [Gordionus sp. m RMFG-2023]|uniref:uncharacterized protein LOC135928725 n=1 Tax=Gordionus sp. m RMFG-2023 TaxID=3053472 RepID=UPI0030DE1EC2
MNRNNNLKQRPKNTIEIRRKEFYEKDKEKREYIFARLRNIEQDDQFIKKFDEYKIKKRLNKEIEQKNKKPMFKFYHVDDKIHINFSPKSSIHKGNVIEFVGENKNRINKKYKIKDKYKDIKAKIDTGLNQIREAKRKSIKKVESTRLEQIIQHTTTTHYIHDDLPETLTLSNNEHYLEPSKQKTIPKPTIRSGKTKELLSILQDSIHSDHYNFRNTPARLSNILNKDIRKTSKINIPTIYTQKNHILLKTPTKKFSKYNSPNGSKINNDLTNKDFNKATSIKTGSNILEEIDVPIGIYPQNGSDLEQVTWFQELYSNHLRTMNYMNKEWKDYLKEHNQELKEETVDEIRTIIGQMNLFKNGRFKQFGSLINQSYHEISGEIDPQKPRTHPSDLMGFWEMIQNQVDDIALKNAYLNEHKFHDWAELAPKKTPSERSLSRKKSSKSSKGSTDLKTPRSIAVKRTHKRKSSQRFSANKPNKRPVKFSEWKLNRKADKDDDDIFSSNIDQIVISLERIAVDQDRTKSVKVETKNADLIDFESVGKLINITNFNIESSAMKKTPKNVKRRSTRMNSPYVKSEQLSMNKENSSQNNEMKSYISPGNLRRSERKSSAACKLLNLPSIIESTVEFSPS